MTDNQNDENPYSPPATVHHRAGVACRSFQVGREEINTVIVETSLWTGLSTHSTDAAGNSTPVQRGPRQFEVGERERHQVEIQVDRTARVNAFVDGELVERNLFPRVRAVIFAMIALFSVSIFVAVFLAMGSIFNE